MPYMMFHCERCHQDQERFQNARICQMPTCSGKLVRGRNPKMSNFAQITFWIETQSPWDDHPAYPVSSWKYEVANGDTREGYQEWMLNQADQKDAEDDDPRA